MLREASLVEMPLYGVLCPELRVTKIALIVRWALRLVAGVCRFLVALVLAS